MWCCDQITLESARDSRMRRGPLEPFRSVPRDRASVCQPRDTRHARPEGAPDAADSLAENSKDAPAPALLSLSPLNLLEAPEQASPCSGAGPGGGAGEDCVRRASGAHAFLNQWSNGPLFAASFFGTCTQRRSISEAAAAQPAAGRFRALFGWRRRHGDSCPGSLLTKLEQTGGR